MMATPRSLSNRLRQHSRRSGFAVGASMALAIAVCIAGFITIYVQLQPYISDFVSQDPPEEEARVAAPVATRRSTAADEDAVAAPTSEPVDDAAPSETVAAEDTPTVEPEPTEDSDEFTPDLQSNPNSSVNLRSEPSTSQGQATVITAISAITPLQSTGETEAADNPASDGNTWIEVEIEDGTVGWIREIDTEPYEE